MSTKIRNDENLGFLLKFENVAWYENGQVKILDRRVYPMEIRYEICKSFKDVAQAIKDMVTQSEGPYTAAAMGMTLAMYEAKDFERDEIYPFLEEAAFALSNARPTTREQMKGIVNGALSLAKEGIEKDLDGQALVDLLFNYAFNYINNNYKRYTTIGENMADLIPHKGKIMVQCFPGTVVGTMLKALREAGKEIEVYCAETRPYLQGARLTASLVRDMGFDVTVITDNMVSYTMKSKDIDTLMSASDVITMDGYIINKVGTFQMALAADYYNIPYYVTGTPDIKHKDRSRIEIEERDPELVLEFLGKKFTMEGVKGYYPGFDVTPPDLCSGIVTDKGLLKTNELYKYFD